MNTIFKWISKIIESRPIKTLLITSLIFALLIAGATQIRMATGNETLVKTTSDAYQSNQSMEQDFGGDSIIVLFESENQNDMLSVENIRKMWNVEKKFRYEERIFSFASPASIVNQMADRQSEMIKSNVKTISDGLKEMAKGTAQLQSGLAGMPKGLPEGMSPDNMSEMADGFISMGDRLAEISSGLNTFYGKSNMMIAEIPTEQDELNNMFFDEKGKLRSLFSDLIINENQVLMIIKLEGNLPDSEKDTIYQKLDNAIENEEFTNISYMISGKPVLDSALRSEMKDNMRMMVGLAVVIMFIILMLIFKVRWRVLSLGIIFTAVIATLGSMGTVGIPMTMVSMAVFPILIGLGIDYSIQFHSRYEEERSLKKTLIQMGPAIGSAVFATVLGFIALYSSPVPMVQDFGKMLTIGVVISYVAGIFLLMTILYLRDQFAPISPAKPKLESAKPSAIEEGLAKMTKIVLRYSSLIIIVAILLTSLGIWVDGRVGVETDIESFMPQNTPELTDIHKLRDTLGSTNQIVLYIADENLLREENINWIKNKTELIEKNYDDIVVGTKSIITLVDKMKDGNSLSYEEYLDTINEIPESQRKIFLNEEATKTIVLLNVKHVPVESLQEFVNSLDDITRDTEMVVKITGKSVLDVEMIKGLTSGRIKMTFIGVGLVFLGLLLVYRNIVKAFIPVFPISLIVGMSGGIMYLLDFKYTPLTATLGALILGIGTEMTILLLERYMEERKEGKDKVEAIQIAVAKIGKAILASGLTTIGGFGVLMISKFIILQDFGLMTVINMSLALFSTLVVLPPVIVLLDRWIVAKEKL